MGSRALDESCDAREPALDVIAAVVGAEEGHRTLQKQLALVEQCNELWRAHLDDTEHVRAFLESASKAGSETTNKEDLWRQSWSNQAIEDPDGRKKMRLTSHVEEVARPVLRKD